MRPVVYRIAEDMEKALDKEQEAQGDSWRTTPLAYLEAELDKQRRKLVIALDHVRHAPDLAARTLAKEQVRKHATHIANYAAMLHRRMGI
jgi:hypothetical protein